jgi:hypothetical protein
MREERQKAMSKALKYTFLIHAIIAFLLGAPLLLGPGHFLVLLGWLHIDTMLSRVLGAALLGLAWSSWRGWQATENAQVKTLLELEAIFTALGALGLLREMITSPFPLIYWLLCALLAVFAIGWILFRFKK